MKKIYFSLFWICFLIPSLFSMDFHSLKSTHFDLRSTRSEAEAALLLSQLEMLYQEAEGLLPESETPPTLRVYDLEDPDQYRFWLKEQWGIDSTQYLLMRPTLLRPGALSLYGDWSSKENMGKLRFLFMTQYLENAGRPPWLVSGMAALFEEYPADDPVQDSWVRWGLSLSQSKEWKSPKELMSLKEEQLSGNSDLKGECRFFIYYLLQTDRSEESRILWDSLSGTLPENAVLPPDMETRYFQFLSSLFRQSDQINRLSDLYDAEDYPEALKLINEMKTSFPAQSWYYQGLIQFKQGKWEEAVDSFQHALDEGAPRESVLRSMAVSYWEWKKLEQCAQKVQELNSLAPEAVPPELKHFVD